MDAVIASLFKGKRITPTSRRRSKQKAATAAPRRVVALENSVNPTKSFRAVATRRKLDDTLTKSVTSRFLPLISGSYIKIMKDGYAERKMKSGASLAAKHAVDAIKTF